MAIQFKVMLTALNDELTPEQRIFSLDPDRRTIPIGRASKTVNKGLQGAADNAWFDSPVMSRDHAELSLSEDNTTLQIKDLGSMHGTLLNSDEIPRKEYTQVNNGDIVTFGAEVQRGIETFPACTFLVNYQTRPYKATNTFALPDSSDLDDDDELVSEGEGPPSASLPNFAQRGPLHSPQSRMSQISEPIDLTRDDSPPTSALEAAELLRVLDSAEESDIEDDSSSSDAKDDYEGIIDSDSDLGYSEIGREIEAAQPQASTIFEENEEFQGVFQSPTSRTITGPHKAMEMVAPNNATHSSNSQKSNVKDPEYDSQVDSVFRIANEAIQKRLGIPRTSVDASVNSNDFNAFGERQPSVDSMTYIAATYDRHAPASIYESRLRFSPPAADNVAQSTSSPLIDYPIAPSGSVYGPRQPSPSDAAMAKPAEIFRSPPQQPPMASDEERLAKLVYFEARDINKQKWTEEFKEEKTEEFVHAPIISHNTAAAPKDPIIPEGRIYAKCRKPMRQRANVDERLSRSFCSSSFDNPEVHPSLLETSISLRISSRKPSPIPDMTSAVKYNESKAAMAAATSKAVTSKVESGSKVIDAPPTSRSGLRIDDIIDTQSAGPVSNGFKRKADAISVEDEVRAWGSSASKPNKRTPATRDSPQKLSEQDNVTTTIQDTDQRPAKKLRTIMEKMGYAALGGVAVGAALFGGLVATAPDFL